MPVEVTRLYPLPGEQLPLEGLYLQHGLHRLGTAGNPYIYSNFITSLDGRIALGSSEQHTNTVPGAITNAHDWRLYQELAAQADVLITSGRYFRQSKLGEAQAQLPLGPEAQFDDLRAWRRSEGLCAEPDIAILSGSLELPLASLEPYRQRRILVFTGTAADPARIEKLRDNGVEVLVAGDDGRVDGAQLRTQLASLGYRSVYAIAGSAVMNTLIAAQVIDRLYLTFAQVLLGGNDFDTLMQGPLLSPPSKLVLQQLYLDARAPANAGQLLATYAINRDD